jgi:hypothetical protein
MVARVGIAHKAGWLAVAAAAAFLVLSDTALAQLALSPGIPVPKTGIPFGATGLDSPGLSPAPAGGSATCSAAGNSLSSLSETAGATYDGGGIGIGTSSLANSLMCGTASGNAVSSAATLASPSPGGSPTAGIPLGSVEISNAGVSPPIAVPTPGLSIPGTNSLPQPTGGTGIPCATAGSPMNATSC